MDKKELQKLFNELDDNKDDGEPALRPAVIIALVGAIGSVLAHYGIDIPEPTSNFIAVFSVFIVPILVGVWIRKNAWSPKTVSAIIDEFKTADEAYEMNKDQ